MLLSLFLCPYSNLFLFIFDLLDCILVFLAILLFLANLFGRLILVFLFLAMQQLLIK